MNLHTVCKVYSLFSAVYLCGFKYRCYTAGNNIYYLRVTGNIIYINWCNCYFMISCRKCFCITKVIIEYTLCFLNYRLVSIKNNANRFYSVRVIGNTAYKERILIAKVLAFNRFRNRNCRLVVFLIKLNILGYIYNVTRTVFCMNCEFN